MLVNYRIIKILTDKDDPCCWQAQRRKCFFFWVPLCGATASATTQAHEIERHARKGEIN
mgnify:CR=1 FL=1